MKNYSIISTNQKGQLVIPQHMRQALQIAPDVSLHISLQGSSLRIVPIKDVATAGDKSSSYLNVLRLTQGSWGGSDAVEDKAKNELEIEASIQRKQAW